MGRFLLPILLLATAMAQAPVSMPDWLAAYPGASPELRANSVLARATYTTSATSAEFVEHYRKLFAAAGLKFQPNSDASGWRFALPRSNAIF
jgi:hypothetical protein